jgi:ABC-2 type transport system permease protein
MLALRPVSMGLAGTDFAQHRHFAEAAEGYRRSFVKAINDDITTHATGPAPYLRGDGFLEQRSRV